MHNIYLSHIVNSKTPTYGNKDQFSIKKQSSISKGDVANNSYIESTVHIGTHIDMPYHFFEDGQSIEDFEANFFEFDDILFLQIQPNSFIVKEELIDKLKSKKDKKKYEIILIKTGIGEKRSTKEFGEKNYGFHPDVADYLNSYFPSVRVFGFDSISVSSFTDRMLGRRAHKAFLNPKKPILLLEDMDLTNVSEKSNFKHITIAPFRIEKCDGLPCTVIAKIQ